MLDVAGNLRSIAVENELPVIKVRRCRGLGDISVYRAGEGKPSVVPGEFSIAQPRLQLDLAARVLRNLQPVVDGVSRPRWYQADINHCSAGPGIALVDRVAVAVNLKRAVKVGALFHRPFSIVFDLA